MAFSGFFWAVCPMDLLLGVPPISGSFSCPCGRVFIKRCGLNFYFLGLISQLKSHENNGDSLLPVSGRMEYHDEKGNIVKCSADSLINQDCGLFRVCDFQVRNCVFIRSCINRASNDSRVKSFARSFARSDALFRHGIKMVQSTREHEGCSDNEGSCRRETFRLPRLISTGWRNSRQKQTRYLVSSFTSSYSHRNHLMKLSFATLTRSHQPVFFAVSNTNF
jgi:primosomal replication protein N